MLNKIKNNIASELKVYARSLDKDYRLSRISPLLSRNIREFLLRKGKRIRPFLFVIGYLGYAKSIAPGLYRSAISLELLHDFLLVHDDIIDKSSTRRGSPSMHTMFNRYLAGQKKIKFDGEDLAIVTGDVMYALALLSFSAIKETSVRKETALRKFIEAVLYTGSGEFLELILSMKDISGIVKADIYKIYDLKTANYTFASPLIMGATLGGADKSEIDRLYRYGIYAGRAFQIKDDIIGAFCSEKETGKTNLSDLRESKKTLLIWQAYHNSENKTKKTIKFLLEKKKASFTDLKRLRKIIIESGSLDHAKKEITFFSNKAQEVIASTRMRGKYKELLTAYIRDILKLK